MRSLEHCSERRRLTKMIPVDTLDVKYCQNCDNESHCGENYKQEARNGRGKFLGEVIVCAKCRCEKCWRPDWG